uniref:Uncharacterized protein n=1 Tax=Borreliella burgdorferi TaxID=139 RepID=Q9X3P1_BORBG|nr:unknown [Borreliella burgdorferi 297]
MKRGIFKIVFVFVIFVYNIYGDSFEDTIIKRNQKVLDLIDIILQDQAYITALNNNIDERKKVPNFEYKEDMVDTVIKELKSYGKASEFLIYFYAVPKKIAKSVPKKKQEYEKEKFKFYIFREIHYLYNSIVSSKKYVDRFMSNILLYIKDLNKRFKT